MAKRPLMMANAVRCQLRCGDSCGTVPAAVDFGILDSDSTDHAMITRATCFFKYLLKTFGTGGPQGNSQGGTPKGISRGDSRDCPLGLTGYGLWLMSLGRNTANAPLDRRAGTVDAAGGPRGPPWVPPHHTPKPSQNVPNKCLNHDPKSTQINGNPWKSSF